MHTVRVSRKGSQRLASGHPWVFAGDIESHGEAAGGEAVRVEDSQGRFLGVAHYSDQSQISLRLLDSAAAVVDREFFFGRFRAAQAHRERVVNDTEAWRAVHAEADGLPGLIVDWYAGHLVLQTLSQGMASVEPLIAECLREVYRPVSVTARNDAAVRAREGLPRHCAVIAGQAPGRIALRMNGLIWHADLLGGQKTGLFLDQRENYRAAARYGMGRALDCFTSTGGFALHLAARCDAVEGVDSSAAAIQTAEANRQANGIGNVSFRQADVFDLLAGYAAAGRRFETVVLDPPAFAKSRAAVESALRGYRDINYRALRLLAHGGVLVTCSCSHHVSEAALLKVIAAASLDAGRPLRILERRTQAADHPILLTVPETHYLKCLILQSL